MAQISSSGLRRILFLGLLLSGARLSRPFSSRAQDVHRQKLLVEATRGSASTIEMEIVVARYKENNLMWLGDIPGFYQIMIYNKASLSPVSSMNKGSFKQQALSIRADYLFIKTLFQPCTEECRP